MGRKPAAPRHVPAEMYRVAEFAEAIGVSRSKAYELIGTGEVPSVRLPGGSVRVPLSEIRKWIDSKLAAVGAEKSAQG